MADDEREPVSYDAFISYRRSDGAVFAQRLRHSLQDYTLPRTFSGERLHVYLDRIYERATEDFFEATIKPALHASRALIVVQTPGAAEQHDDGSENWVAREVRYFASIQPRRPIWVALAIGDFSDPLPADLHVAFPNVERVDIRPYGRWWARASETELLKFIGPLHNVPESRFPDLRQEAERRTRNRRIGAAVAAMLVLLALSTATYLARAAQSDAERERNNADAARQTAEQQRDDANKLLDTYLRVSTMSEIDRGAFNSARGLLERIRQRDWEWHFLFARTARASPDGRWSIRDLDEAHAAEIRRVLASAPSIEFREERGVIDTGEFIIEWEAYGGRPGAPVAVYRREPRELLRTIRTGVYSTLRWVVPTSDHTAMIMCVADDGDPPEVDPVDPSAAAGGTAQFLMPLDVDGACGSGERTRLYVFGLPDAYCLRLSGACSDEGAIPSINHFDGVHAIAVDAFEGTAAVHEIDRIARTSLRAIWNQAAGSYVPRSMQAPIAALNIHSAAKRWVFRRDNRTKAFVVGPDNGIEAWDVETQTREWRSTTSSCRSDAQEGNPSSEVAETPTVVISPKGRWIALDPNGFTHNIELIDAASGVRRCIEGTTMVSGARTVVRNEILFSLDGSRLFISQVDGSGAGLEVYDVQTGQLEAGAADSEDLKESDRTYVPAVFGFDPSGQFVVTADAARSGRRVVTIRAQPLSQPITQPQLLYDPLELPSVSIDLGGLRVSRQRDDNLIQLENYIVDATWRVTAQIGSDSERVTLSDDWQVGAVTRTDGRVFFVSLQYANPAIRPEALTWRDSVLRLDLCERLIGDTFATEFRALSCRPRPPAATGP